MSVVLVANPKGGVGKSTLATNIAGHFAARGHGVMLGDLDRQQSSALWLRLRPPAARSIQGWELDKDRMGKPPRATTHVVLDTPAGFDGRMFEEALRIADKVVVPLQPSVFDIFATRAFLDELMQHRRASQLRIGIVGMRVDARTIAADKLQEFTGSLGLPVLGCLRPTQNYVHLAASGLTLFDVPPSKVERDLEQWQELCRWLDN